MDHDKKENNLKRVMSLTNIIRYPKQQIYTFGDTDFKYKIVSSNQESGSTLRIGKLRCKSPTIVTPETFLQTFQGFSGDAEEFARRSYADIVSRIRVLGYQFLHIHEQESQYSESARQVTDRILGELSESQIDIAVLTSPDDLWGIALVKVMFDVLKKSVRGNIEDLNERGFFLSETERKKQEIEILFSEAQADQQYINELAERLRDYNLFGEYEDRFFQFFK